MIPEALSEYFDSILSDEKQYRILDILVAQYCNEREIDQVDDQLTEDMRSYIVLVRNYTKIKLFSERLNTEIKNNDEIKPKERPLYESNIDMIDQYIMIHLNMDSLEIQLYKTESELFSYMLTAIYDSIIADTELLLWRNASGKSAASIERMFALKAKRPEYKDNAPASGDQLTRLNITINGEQVKLDTDTTNKPEKPVEKLPEPVKTKDASHYKTSALKDMDLDLDLEDL